MRYVKYAENYIDTSLQSLNEIRLNRRVPKAILLGISINIVKVELTTAVLHKS